MRNTVILDDKGRTNEDRFSARLQTIFKAASKQYSKKELGLEDPIIMPIHKHSGKSVRQFIDLDWAYVAHLSSASSRNRITLSAEAKAYLKHYQDLYQ